MKAILEFDLPNDSGEFRLASTASDMYNTLWEMDQWLRSVIKYAPDSMSDDTMCALEQCREKLYEICEVHNINFDL
jgi:hypothetical protein